MQHNDTAYNQDRRNVNLLTSQPPSSYLNDSKLISINVSNETPVKDLLVEIGKLSDINLSIDPNISGNIILKLKKKSINEVIQSIAYSANLRYSIDNDIIRIEQDLPYIQNYYIDFIDIQNSSYLMIDDNNQMNKVSNQSKERSDLWSSFEKGLSTIVNDINNDEFFLFNKEAGVIVLNARKNMHKSVEEYVLQIKKLASYQVMIEAKVVEVQLNNQYPYGVDLNDLCNISCSIENLNTKNLSKFGSSKVISSTKVDVVNNQQAMVSFIKDNVYFTSEIHNKDFIATKKNNVQVGIVLIMYPSINFDTNEVLINLNPTLSRINGYTRDPGIEYFAQRSKMKLNSNIPLLEVRKMNSTVKTKSGETRAISLLVENKGKIFNKKSEVKNMETIIFLRATVVPVPKLLNQNLYS